MGFRIWGLGFEVWGLGFGVWGLGFGVRTSVCSIELPSTTTLLRARCFTHTVHYDSFITNQLASRQLILGNYLVQLWTRQLPKLGSPETFVVHRVVRPAKPCECRVRPAQPCGTPCALSGISQPEPCYSRVSTRWETSARVRSCPTGFSVQVKLGAKTRPRPTKWLVRRIQRPIKDSLYPGGLVLRLPHTFGSFISRLEIKKAEQKAEGFTLGCGGGADASRSFTKAAVGIVGQHPTDGTPCEARRGGTVGAQRSPTRRPDLLSRPAPISR